MCNLKTTFCGFYNLYELKVSRGKYLLYIHGNVSFCNVGNPKLANKKNHNIG